jgi:hypothetical protein
MRICEETMITKRRIIISEEIEDLEPRQGPYKTEDVTDALTLLQSILLPGELMSLARKMERAQKSGLNVLVGIEFTHGHPKSSVYNERENLPRE